MLLFRVPAAEGRKAQVGRGCCRQAGLGFRAACVFSRWASTCLTDCAPAPAAPRRVQTILHTGDFRWQPSMAQHPALRDLQVRGGGRLIRVLPVRSCHPPFTPNIFLTFHPAHLSCQVDLLFLDTTYCQPKWALPPQADAVALAAAEMRREAEACPGACARGASCGAVRFRVRNAAGASTHAMPRACASHDALTASLHQPLLPASPPSSPSTKHSHAVLRGLLSRGQGALLPRCGPPAGLACARQPCQAPGEAAADGGVLVPRPPWGSRRLLGCISAA